MKKLLFATILLSSFAANAAPICHDILKEKFEIDNRPLRIEEVNYQQFGDSSKPSLILIHGLDSAWQTFLNVVHKLGADYHVTVLDQRGHGKTADGGWNFDSKTMADDLLVLMNHLNIKKAHILGHSMGARTAVRFSSLYPDRVSALIIEDMEMHQRSQDYKNIQRKAEARAIQLRALPTHYSSREALIETLTPLFGKQAESLSYRRATQNEDGSMNLLFRPAVTVLYGTQGNSENLLYTYAKLKVPTLVMQANPEAAALENEGLAIMKKLKPKATYALFPDATHVIHRSNEEKFLSTLHEFLLQYPQ